MKNIQYFNIIYFCSTTNVARCNMLQIMWQLQYIRADTEHFTDIKVIDSLIWAYVSLLKNGGAMNGIIPYAEVAKGVVSSYKHMLHIFVAKKHTMCYAFIK